MSKDSVKGAKKHMKRRCLQYSGTNGTAKKMTTKEDWQHLWRIRDKRDRKKVNRRWMDRYYFRKVLSKEMYDKYEICHDWDNGAICTLQTPWMHRGAKYKGNQKRW